MPIRFARRNPTRTFALALAGIAAAVGLSAAGLASASATPVSNASTVVAQSSSSQTFMVMNRTNRTLFVALSNGSRKLTHSVPADGYWMPVDDFTGYTVVTAQDGGFVFAGSIMSDGADWSSARVDYAGLANSTLDNHGMLVLAD
ncbi:MAG: hypothetical protein WC054_11840 [Candidatus Nanopelagicales bacterium]